MKIVHCSYHKCLTTYYQKIFNKYFKLNNSQESYIHFKSDLIGFERFQKLFPVCSINNHFIDVDAFEEDVKFSRFIRDPRDLVVSGYYYHKRAAEPWTKIKNPHGYDWTLVNGVRPSLLEKSETYAELLNRLSVEDGLIAQIEFRRFHFESMQQWPVESNRVKLLKYEDIVGREVEAFSELFNFYGFDRVQSEILLKIVKEFSAKNAVKTSTHIRDPKLGQWKNLFTPKVEDYFNSRYGNLLALYGY